jgi:hypothetical protein
MAFSSISACGTSSFQDLRSAIWNARLFKCNRSSVNRLDASAEPASSPTSKAPRRHVTNGRSFTTSEVALVTTFTTDLSVTIEHLIAQLSPEAAKLIEVQSASTRAHHLPAVSVVWTDCDDQELGEIWDALLPPASEPDEFDRQFVKEEYESVVDAMGVTSRSGK